MPFKEGISENTFQNDITSSMKLEHEIIPYDITFRISFLVCISIMVFISEDYENSKCIHSWCNNREITLPVILVMEMISNIYNEDQPILSAGRARVEVIV